MMNPNALLLVVGWLLVFVPVGVAQQPKPNIVVIVEDDTGDVGGCPVLRMSSISIPCR